MPSKEAKQVHIHEEVVEGKRLGRHLHHDPKSLDYPISQFLDPTKPLKTKTHRRYIPPLDQGNLGSCTGNACAGMLASSPLHTTLKKGIKITEDVAVALYSKATMLDPFPGTYPPKDTGSSTLGVLKAAQSMGYITSYYWGFGVGDMRLTVDQIGPVIVGTNWYEGMDNPDGEGHIHTTGQVRGGHEYEIIGIDVLRQAFLMENSWGAGWGRAGRAFISWHDMDKLLSEGGEVGIGRA